jgi:3-dehydroquinate synthase
MINTLPGLNDQLRSLSLPDVLNRFASDKKHTAGHYTLILVAATGEVVLERIPCSQHLESSIAAAISATIDSIASPS